MIVGQNLGESPMPQAKKARAVGFNHVALEVGDIEEALAFYGRLFDFELRGKSPTSAFIDLGDQFLALQKGRTQAADDGRHFGLVVPAGFSISSTRGATASRSSPTIISNSVRRRTYCAAWDSRICRRTQKRLKSFPTRAWRRAKGRPPVARNRSTIVAVFTRFRLVTWWVAENRSFERARKPNATDGTIAATARR